MSDSGCRNRRISPWLLLLLLHSCAPARSQTTTGPLPYVDPFIGTSVSDVPTRWGNEGGCYPGAVAVSGFFQLTPETRHAALSGYDYRDSSILLFSCFQHNSGFPGGSAGDLYLMPVCSDSNFVPFKTRRSFSHSGECASPGYYAVRLTDDGTLIETTATTRTGLFRIRFPGGTVPRIFIGDAGALGLDDDSSLSAPRYHLQVKFNHRVVGQERSADGTTLRFDAAKTGSTEIEIRLAASQVSAASALANLGEEAPPTLSFDTVKNRTAIAWQKKLSVALIEDPDTVQKKIFYTALYHSLLIPWIVSDVHGNYRGRDSQVHMARGSAEYGNFSPWDTYRSLNPLRALLFPGIEKDVALSMFDIFLQTGRLPVESMTGNHAIAIMADDYAKELLTVDKYKLFRALQSNVTDSPFVQRDMSAYSRNGYLSSAWPESVTRTIEYGYDDWVLSVFARTVMQDETKADRYASRSFGYRQMFDPVSRLLLPREGKGFLDHAGTTGYKEGDAWAYNYDVPQDVKGLSNLSGGDSSFVSVLDSALRQGKIYFDNETVFHVPWLFNESGAPEKTQYWVARLRSERFHATPGGLPGNDDLGSTSSWFVWSALGFYPLTPGRPLYTIASPLFRKITLQFENGKTLRIVRPHPGWRVTSITRNLEPYGSLSVPHKLLSGGGDWEFKTTEDDTGSGQNPSATSEITTGNAYPFSETKTGSDIRINSVTVSGKSVRPDEPFRIFFTAKNKAAAGSIRVAATDGSSLLGSVTVLLDSGETKNAELVCRAYQAGTRTIAVGENRLVVTVTADQKEKLPGYRISEWHARSLLRTGEEQSFSYTVKNTGGRPGRFAIPVRVNGKPAAPALVALGAGEAKTITGHVSVTEAGKQQLHIGPVSFPFRVFRSPAGSVLLDLKWTVRKDPVKKDSGFMLDRSGFGNNGRWVAGETDTLTSENEGVGVGDGKYISVASAECLDRMDSSLTMMAWIFPGRNAAGLADIFSKGDHHVIQLSGPDKLTFFAGGWGRGDCSVRLPADWTGHWHHIAGVCNGRQLKVYLDGVEAGSTLTDEPVNLSTENHWNLGRNEEFPGIRMFTGRLNYVRVYAEALAEPEIRSEMARERPQP